MVIYLIISLTISPTFNSRVNLKLPLFKWLGRTEKHQVSRSASEQVRIGASQTVSQSDKQKEKQPESIQTVS